MMSSRMLVFALALVAGCALPPPQPPAPRASPQPPPAAVSRADVPGEYAIEPTRSFLTAVQRGTRTSAGRPGVRYWQNRASYRLAARLDANARQLAGSVEIIYRNDSPDTLDNLHLDLTQNFHAAGAMRFEQAEVTDGVQLQRVAVGGRVLGTDGQGARYSVFGTRLVILPPEPIAPRQTVTISIDWAFGIPQAGAGERMGYGADLFFLAYWYPQMAVYDDVVGWHPDPFVGTTEFYHGFASYDVTIDVPTGWVVMATGELMNADSVLAPAVLERYRRALQTDEIVPVLRAADFANATRAGAGGRLRWRFVADSVRDVAFSVTRRSNWDATRTPVGDRDGDGRTDYARINSFWRQSAPRWAHVARYAAHAISFLSRYLALPYPWPHMTAVEAGEIIGGGMEFPMLTLIGDYNQRGDSALYFVTAHELAHMWFPMIASSDERRYTWMDEGTTTFNENNARMDFYPGRNHHLDDQAGYLQIAGSGEEGEIMRRSAYHYSPEAYGIASYAKPASVLVALRAVLGEELFNRAYREYLQRWKYRHPYPWDMWNTFEDVSGRDLDWFWRAWYFETWTLDHAIARVTHQAAGSEIVIADHGRIPMPAHLVITFADGRAERREVPVEHWLAGHREAAITVNGDVTRVEIDAARAFPDVNRRNNVWSR